MIKNYYEHDRQLTLAFEIAARVLTEEGYRHALRVMAQSMDNVPIGFPDGGSYRTVAILHDVLEDSHLTQQLLYPLFDTSIVDDVVTLTHVTAHETYHEYIDQIARGSARAIHTKLADLYDHLAEKETLSPSLRPRYEKAIETLKDSLTSD